MGRSTYHLAIPSSTSHLEEVRRFVEKHARQAGFNGDAVDQLKIAVDEACTNVIKHAYCGNPDHQVDISVNIASDRFTISIRDKGIRFDPNAYHLPNIFESVRQHRAGGYGVHIMRSLMDQVEYRSKGPVNEVCLIKYRQASPAGTAECGC